MREKTVDFPEALEMLSDGTPTILIPCFLTTNQEDYKDEVIRRAKQLLKKPEACRIYLIFQEGISKQKTRSVWDVLIERAAKENLQGDNLKIYSFGNIPTDLLLELCDSVKNVEVV